MNDDEKLMWMFEQVHGKVTGKCYTKIVCDEGDSPTGVDVMKDGNLCWSASKTDIMFDYLTKHLSGGRND